MGSYKPVTHVLFDVDGLLLDTERLYTEGNSNLAKEYGKVYTWATKVKAMGMNSTDAAKTIIHDLGLPLTVPQYFERMKKEYKDLFPTANLLPGVGKLVKHLKKCNIPIAIATSSKRSSFDLKTTNHGDFVKLFHHIVCASDDPEIKEGKPCPDIFLVCASRFPDCPDPEKVLVFEDAPNGVEAAIAAGMQVVMVPDPRVSTEMKAKATLALETMEEFVPEQFGLPPY